MNESSDAINWVRWLFYLLAGVPLLTWLFFTRDSVMRLVAVIAFQMFLQDSIIGRRYVIGGASLAPSFALVYVALTAEVLKQRRLPQLGVYLPLWIGFLFFAASNIVLGSISTGLWDHNIKQFQIYYLEGIVLFMYGAIALRRHEDVIRFTRWSLPIAFGVALIHIFSVATGFRFRNAILSGEGIEGLTYAGVLDNANSLGTYYTMLIPVGLALAVGPRQSSGWRLVTFAAIGGMLGSLILTVSRGGILFTILMSFVALAISRLGAMRALLAVGAGGAATAVGYVLMVSIASYKWQAMQEIASEEGLKTNRFWLFARYSRMLLDHPFGLGLSPRNFQLVLPEYGIPGVASAHNIYLDIPLQTGIPGLMLFLAITGMVLYQNRRAARATRDPQATQALAYTFLPVLGFLAIGFFEPVFTISNKLNNLFWILCGLSVAASQVVFASLRTEQTAYVPGEALAPDPRAQRV